MYGKGEMCMDKLVTVNNKDTVSSLEVAKMMEKEHKDLLKDIRRYAQYFIESNFPLNEYFIKTSYKDKIGRQCSCYNVTRKGCEFLASKLTGKKGVVFSVRYIDRFHEMEEKLKKPQTYIEALECLLESERAKQKALEEKKQLEQQLEKSKEWYSIKRVSRIHDVNWKSFNWRTLKAKSQEMGYEVKKIFDANYGEVNVYHVDVWEQCYPEYEL